MVATCYIKRFGITHYQYDYFCRTTNHQWRYHYTHGVLRKIMVCSRPWIMKMRQHFSEWKKWTFQSFFLNDKTCYRLFRVHHKFEKSMSYINVHEFYFGGRQTLHGNHFMKATTPAPPSITIRAKLKVEQKDRGIWFSRGKCLKYYIATTRENIFV